MTKESGKKQEAKTTIEFMGETYPFYRTNRGMFSFENSGYSMEDITKGKQSAMLAQIYYQLKDCAKRAKLEFKYSFAQFIDNTEPDVFKVFSRLQKESKRINEEAEKKETGSSQEA